MFCIRRRCFSIRSPEFYLTTARAWKPRVSPGETEVSVSINKCSSFPGEGSVSIVYLICSKRETPQKHQWVMHKNWERIFTWTDCYFGSQSCNLPSCCPRFNSTFKETDTILKRLANIQRRSSNFIFTLQYSHNYYKQNIVFFRGFLEAIVFRFVLKK